MICREENFMVFGENIYTYIYVWHVSTTTVELQCFCTCKSSGPAASTAFWRRADICKSKAVSGNSSKATATCQTSGPKKAHHGPQGCLTLFFFFWIHFCERILYLILVWWWHSACQVSIHNYRFILCQNLKVWQSVISVTFFSNLQTVTLCLALIGKFLVNSYKKHASITQLFSYVFNQIFIYCVP